MQKGAPSFTVGDEPYVSGSSASDDYPFKNQAFAFCVIRLRRGFTILIMLAPER